MESMTRRRFSRYVAGAGAALALPWATRAAGGLQLRKYVQPVPLPGAGIVGDPERRERVLVPADRDHAPAAPGPAADYFVNGSTQVNISGCT
jgi:hypothetical protein